MNVISQNSSATSSSFDILSPKILFVLPKTSTGTATNGVLYRDIKTREDASVLFGATSPMNDAIQTYFDFITPNGVSRKVGRFKTTLNAVSYDITGTAGVQNIALTGTPVDGEIVLYFNSQRKNTITVKTLTTDTLAVIATKIANALNSFNYSTFIATTSTANVVITASMPGEWFNSLPYKILKNTSGTLLAKTTTSAGTGSMDLTSVINQIKPYKFHFIHIPFLQVTTAIKEFIQGRVGLTKNKSLSGFLYYSDFNKTIQNHTDNIEIDKSRQGLVYVVQKQGQEQDNEYNICAKAMLSVACKMAEYTISDYVARSDVNNGIGGAQFTNQTMVGSLLPLSNVYTIEQDWTSDEIERLDELDCVYFRNNDVSTGVIFGRENTTYSISLEGEIPNIRTVAEWNTVLQATGLQVEGLVKEYTGSTLQKGNNVINGTTQVSEQQLITSFKAHYIKIGGVDIENNIVFGWVAIDSLSVEKFENEIKRTFAINYITGAVSVGQLSTVLGSLVQIYINNVFSK